MQTMHNLHHLHSLTRQCKHKADFQKHHLEDYSYSSRHRNHICFPSDTVVVGVDEALDLYQGCQHLGTKKCPIFGENMPQIGFLLHKGF